MHKKIVNIILLIFGLVLMSISIFFLQDESAKILDGMCIGVGAGLLGLSVSNLIMQNWFQKHPKEMKQSEIDFKDERNTIIRCRAKAKCADMIQWVIMGTAWITIIAGLSLWITLLLIGVFLLKNVMEWYFMSKYSKEM